LATIVGNCPSWKAQRTKEGVRYKDPKYGRARIVSLSSTIITELKAHHARQAEEQLRLGIRPGDDSFVVAQYDEKPIQPRSLTHEWVQIVGKTTLPRTDSHHPRHTHAPQMPLAGAHPKIASERLGHSSIGTALDLYSHVMPGMRGDSVEQVDLAIRSAVKAKP
jgi:integrase